MASAKDFKTKAGIAFQNGNWVEAIEKYSEAIALDASDAASLSNRSAAYLKAGYPSKALTDAQRCRKLEPNHSAGYLRESAVAFASQDYKASMVPLQDGLQHCQGDAEHMSHLQTAMVRSQRALVLQLPAAKFAGKMMAALLSAQLRRTASTEAQEIGLRNALERKVGPLYQASLQNKGDLLEAWDSLEEQDILNVLFYCILDPTGNGAASPKHLEPLVWPSPDMEQLWKSLWAFDKCGESVSAQAFAIALQKFAMDLNSNATKDNNKISIKDVAESILHQTMTHRMMKAPSSSSSNAKEDRIVSLFSILDPDGLSTVSFYDMACGIYAWALKNLDAKLQSPTRLLLMMEAKDTRRLDYPQFGKFLLSLSSAWDLPMEEVLDDLVLAFTTTKEEQPLSEEALAEIIVGTTASSSRDLSAEDDTLDALTYARAKQLFSLFDTDGDGTLDFAELLSGLRRYQKANSTDAASALMEAERIAIMIMGHDEDRNQTLDPEEFAKAMVGYAKEAETDVHSLIDFMTVVCQKKEDDDTYEKAYSEATMMATTGGAKRYGYSRPSTKAFRHSSLLMTISDMEEVDEEEGDEED